MKKNMKRITKRENTGKKSTNKNKIKIKSRNEKNNTEPLK
jgi:hypothetical protein